jgi:transcriptional regulator with XRE-family HTH domain
MPIRTVADRIRSARQSSGLTQRELAERVGIPQGHISRIENAAVDVQVSTLIQIARALDLELVLLPRNALPAVAALRESRPAVRSPDVARTIVLLASLRARARRLAERFPRTPVLKRLAGTVTDLEALAGKSPAGQMDELSERLDNLERVFRRLKARPASAPPGTDQVREAETLELELRRLRDAMVHGQFAPPVQMPAYTLDEEPGDG